jgi:hypothetical protein
MLGSRVLAEEEIVSLLFRWYTSRHGASVVRLMRCPAVDAGSTVRAATALRTGRPFTRRKIPGTHFC